MTFQVPAALMFDTDEAKVTGEPLLNVFKQLFDAVAKSEASRKSACCESLAGSVAH
jgi:hypothetical protein